MCICCEYFRSCVFSLTLPKKKKKKDESAISKHGWDNSQFFVISSAHNTFRHFSTGGRASVHNDIDNLMKAVFHSPDLLLGWKYLFYAFGCFILNFYMLRANTRCALSYVKTFSQMSIISLDWWWRRISLKKLVCIFSL